MVVGGGVLDRWVLGWGGGGVGWVGVGVGVCWMGGC